MKLYQQVADQISRQISAGVLRPGDRIPSVRKAMRSQDVSLATVLQAYRLLENRGEITASPRSGYYVSANWAGLPPEPRMSAPTKRSEPVAMSDLIFEILESIKSTSFVPLGSAFIHPSLFPLSKLARFIGAAARRMTPETMAESLPPGNRELRRGIARRYLDSGMTVRPDEIVVTSGALEALTLSLKAVAGPGDVIAIEAPTFYAAIQALQLCRLKALQLPTHPREGIDLPSLATALDKQAIKACWLMTSFQNPLGSLMPLEKKKELVKLLARHEVPLIEDDVYDELYFGTEKPRPAKAFDHKGLVLHCSSFSKTLSPGYRVGWAVAGQFTQQIEREKWMTTLTTNIPGQAAVADFLKQGGYDHYLRGLRRSLELQRDELLRAVGRHFPAGTQVTRPDGGYFVWVELPESIDALKLYRMAMDNGISVAPGPVFSAQGGFGNCLRLNYGQPWTPRMHNAVATLGKLASSLM